MPNHRAIIDPEPMALRTSPPAASLARSRFHTRLGATVPTVMGYLPLVLLPAAFLSRPGSEHPRWEIWAPALVGLVAAPLWSLTATAVRGERPRSPRGPDRDALRHDAEVRLIEQGRMAAVWGLVGSYATLLAGNILLTVAHAVAGDVAASSEPSYGVMLPGLAVAIVAPFVPRVAGLGRRLWWALTEPRPRHGALLESDGVRLLVRLDDGETLALDAASTSTGAPHGELPTEVWIAGGAPLAASDAHPYQSVEPTLHGAHLDTSMDRRFRARAVAALVMELAVLPVVPALWFTWLLTRL